MNIAIIGAGGWGVALSVLLHDNGHKITLWSALTDEVKLIRETRENVSKLPGIIIPNDVIITSNIEEAVNGKEILVFAVPSSFIRKTSELVKPFIKNNQIIVSVAKGLEDDTLFTLKQVINDVMPDIKVAVLSGPSHAEEVSRHIPTSVIAASTDRKTVKLLQEVFMNNTFRVYGCSDVLGVEIGAATKNVIALAAGIGDGLGFGDNSKAALMTRGMAEIIRLGKAMGAKKETFNGLSGMGDLIVTCTSMHSRNRRAGILIGKGMRMQDALDEIKMVVEGVYSAQAVLHLAKKFNVEMPITESINNILFLGMDPREEVIKLMNRDKKFED